MNDNKENSVNENTALARNDEQLGFLGEVWEKIRLVYKLMLDPEVPLYLKLLPFAGIVYLLLPFDFLPDVIPGLGQLDDLTILIVGAKVFIDMAPHQIVERHIRNMRLRESSIPTSSEMKTSDYLEDDPDIIEGIIIDEANDVDLSGNS